jgi:tetratricopeptide (TPR) repeat protein
MGEPDDILTAFARMHRGLCLMYSERLDEARNVLERALAHIYAATGTKAAADAVLRFLAEVECRAGRFQRALERAEEAELIIGHAAGSEANEASNLYCKAFALAYLGRVEECRDAANQGDSGLR